jgi:hypothetical protein
MNIDDMVNELRKTVEAYCPTVRHIRMLNPTELYYLLFPYIAPSRRQFWSNFQWVKRTRNIQPIDITRALSVTINNYTRLKQAKPDILYISIDSNAVLFFFSLVAVTATISNGELSRV